MPKINKFLMPKEDFLNLIQEAGFTKNDFLNLIACKENVYYTWIRSEEFPIYLKIILELAVKLRKIKENFGKELELIEKNRKLKKELALKKGTKDTFYWENNNYSMLQDFNDLIFKCGFKSYSSLSSFLHCHMQTILYWNRTGNYPKYLKQLLEWLILIQEYNNNKNKKYEELKQKNLELKQKLEDCKAMKKMLESKLNLG